MTQSNLDSSVGDNKPAARSKRQYRTTRQWQEMIDACEQSNLSQAEFCKQEGIAISNLYAWRRKLANRGTAAVDSFVELRPAAAQTPSAHWEVELELGAGRLLRIRVR